MLNPVLVSSIIKNDVKRVPTCFDALMTPVITPINYINRWYIYSGSSKEACVLALIFINRLKIPIDLCNFHRVFAIANTVATKIHDDDYRSMPYYADVAGIPMYECIYLEQQFLIHIDFDLYVTRECYNFYHNMFSEE